MTTRKNEKDRYKKTKKNERVTKQMTKSKNRETNKILIIIFRDMRFFFKKFQAFDKNILIFFINSSYLKQNDCAKYFVSNKYVNLERIILNHIPFFY